MLAKNRKALSGLVLMTVTALVLATLTGAGGGGWHEVPCEAKPFGAVINFMSRAGYWRWLAHVIDVDWNFGRGADAAAWVERAEANELVRQSCR